MAEDDEEVVDSEQQCPVMDDLRLAGSNVAVDRGCVTDAIPSY